MTALRHPNMVLMSERREPNKNLPKKKTPAKHNPESNALIIPNISSCPATNKADGSVTNAMPMNPMPMATHESSVFFSLSSREPINAK